MNIIRFIIVLLFSMVLMKTYAGTDPVSWSLSPSGGFRAVDAGESTSVVYTLTVNPTFPNPVILYTKFTKTGATFTIVDNCNNQSLTRGQSCTVRITFTPTVSIISSIQMSYQYNNNVIPLATLQIQGTAITTENIVASISNLPSQFFLSNPEQQPIFTVTYTNQGSIDVTGYAGNTAGTDLLSVHPETGATVTVQQNFCGTSSAPIVLRSGYSCTISGQLTPKALGPIVVSGVFTYDTATKTAVAHGTSTIVNGSGACQVSGEATLPFQNPTYQYADNVLKFTFTNHCVGQSVTLGNVSYTASGTSSSPMITPSAGSSTALFDTCSGVTLTPGGSCTVLVSIIPQAAGSLSVTASVTGNSLVSEATTSTTVQTPSYNHHITFVNQCPFPVWYGVSQPSGSSDPTPNPSPSAYLLPAQASNATPSTKAITIPNTYNGQFFPRTGCEVVGNSFICKTGDCTAGTNAQCQDGTVYEPYTRIEETFGSTTTQGGYDIALINGANIPTELKGLGPLSIETASPAAPYWCTGAGAPIQPPYSFSPVYPPAPPPQGPVPPPTPLGHCPWTYSPPAPSAFLYNFVTNDRVATNCSDCSSSEVCGVAFKTVPSAGQIILACGELIGYWSITQLCSNTVTWDGPSSLNPTTVFHCGDPLSNYSTQMYPSGTTVTVYDLYACRQPDPAFPNTLSSCYNPPNGNTVCCGAKDWNTATPYITWQTSQAYQANPDWVNGCSGGGCTPLAPTPLASIQWLKEACRTAYSYPYDDHAGTFNCDTSNGRAVNTNPMNPPLNPSIAMDFEIVFCPGGLYSNLTTTP